MKDNLKLHRRIMGALCALALLAGGWPSLAAAKPLTAILLVARNDLSDPYFGGSIVLVMNDLGPGPVGLILNRPTPMPVSRLLPQLKRLSRVSDKVYFGGPVEFDTVWFLFRAKRPPRHAVHVLGEVYLSSNEALLHTLLGRERPMRGLRIYVGHAGWAPGQLQAEIAAGFWTLRNADEQAIFSHRSEFPWPTPKELKPTAEHRPAKAAAHQLIAADRL